VKSDPPSSDKQLDLPAALFEDEELPPLEDTTVNTKPKAKTGNLMNILSKKDVAAQMIKEESHTHTNSSH